MPSLTAHQHSASPSPFLLRLATCMFIGAVLASQVVRGEDLLHSEDDIEIEVPADDDNGDDNDDDFIETDFSSWFTHSADSSSNASDAQSEQRRLQLLASVAEALEVHALQGRSELLPVLSDDILGVWRLETKPLSFAEKPLRFFLFFESTLNVKLKAGMKGNFTDSMTLQEKLQWANQWNRDNKFAKLVVDEDEDFVMEYDLDLEMVSEPSAPLIAEAVRVFEVSLTEAVLQMALPNLRDVLPQLRLLMRMLKSAAVAVEEEDAADSLDLQSGVM